MITNAAESEIEDDFFDFGRRRIIALFVLQAKATLQNAA